MDQEKSISRSKDQCEDGLVSLPAEKNQQVIYHASFSGPIPPPNALEAYERICPGAADRILAMAEKQAEHRRGLEKTMSDADTGHELLGMIFAFVLTIGLMCFGFWLLKNGKDVAAYFAIFGPVVFQAGGFIYRKRSETKSEEKKQEDEEEN